MLKRKPSRPGHVGLRGETYAMQASQIILRNSVSGDNLGKLLNVGGDTAMPWLPRRFKCQRDLH